MPQATETLRLSIAGAIGRRAARSQRSRTRRRTPLPSAPSTRARLSTSGAWSIVGLGGAVEGDPPVAQRCQLVERAGEVGDLDHRQQVQRARGGLGDRAAELGAAALRQHHRAHLERGRRAQDRADVVRVGDLVEQEDQVAAGLGGAGAFQVEARQGRCGQSEALVDRALAEAAVELLALDGGDFEAGAARGRAEAGEALGGREQAVAAAPRVGERRLDRVAAVEPQAPGGFRLAARGGARRRLGRGARRRARRLMRGPARLPRCGLDPGRSRFTAMLRPSGSRLTKRLAITILPPTFSLPGKWFGGIVGRLGGVAEWLKAADCKSARVRVRRFESYPLHHKPRCREPRSQDRWKASVSSAADQRAASGCSSMVELQPSKLAMWVRFPSPAPRPCRAVLSALSI